MHKRLVIIGAGGHGKVIADIAIKMKVYDSIIFLDDDSLIKQCMGFPVVGTTKNVECYIQDCDIFVGIGSAKIRQKFQELLMEKGVQIPTLVHPSAIIGSNVRVGEGTVIMAGVVINPDSSIGKGCIINTSSSIDHECVIKDYAHISVGAHLAGTVEIGERTWVGMGAVVNNNLKITGDCQIGSGAVVIRDIPNKCTVVGNPSKTF